MRDPEDDAELARRFRESAGSCRRRAPLYGALSDGIATTPRLYRLLNHAPPTQRLPVLLLASVHALLLEDPDHRLAAWYPNLTEHHRSPADPALIPTFTDFVGEREDDLEDLLATRSTQTNEVGRCLMLLVPMGQLSAEVGQLAMVDVGTSGGLNLLLDRYEYRYTTTPDEGDAADHSGDGTPTHVVGGPSTVILAADVRGRHPLALPTSMPTLSARCGIDANPIDVTDDGEAHWLEACVWPDQRDRFLRLRSAIEIARADPPEILVGDAVASLAPAIQQMARRGHPVVTNSWVLNYLTPAQRTAYVAELDRIGAERDLSWIVVEAPALTPELPWGPGRVTEFEHTTVTALVRWRDGRRTVDFVATSHPHGFWIQPTG